MMYPTLPTASPRVVVLIDPPPRGVPVLWQAAAAAQPYHYDTNHSALGVRTNLPPPKAIEMDDGEYNNCKQLRRGSSLYEQARSPREIISSICNDFSWSLLRDLILSIACFLFGVHGPKIFILPLIGGLTVRPIPYQVTAAGDVMLDLAFAIRCYLSMWVTNYFSSDITNTHCNQPWC